MRADPDACYREFVTHLIETEGNASEALLRTFPGWYKNKQVAWAQGCEFAKKPEVNAILRETLGMVQANPTKAASIISEACSATKLVGSGSDRVEIPDHAARLRAAELIIKLYDGYPKPDQAQKGKVIDMIPADEPEEVLRFMVLYGRKPTDTERQKLIEPGGPNGS